jgi:hypothetical protein
MIWYDLQTPRGDFWVAGYGYTGAVSPAEMNGQSTSMFLEGTLWG